MKTLHSTRKAAGFTLIEMMIAVAVAGILSSIAYPSFQGAMHKARRSDAQVALMQLHMAQERYRSDHASYASLADLGLLAKSPSGHYALAVTATNAAGFRAQAIASGVQSSDATCRQMQIAVEGLQVTYLSGADDSLSNTAAANKKCWGA